jgi:thiol:disulfide interchange protein
VGRNPWRQERQFGISVGLVLLAAAAYFVWRGRGPVFVGVPAVVGGLLAVLGAIVPRALVYPNRAWMAFAEALSFVSVRVVLGLLFYLVFTPLGAWRRWRGWDPLNRRTSAGRTSFWHPYSPRQADPKHYERMF